MNQYINLTLENIDKEHICCAIGDPKHQAGVDCQKRVKCPGSFKWLLSLGD